MGNASPFIAQNQKSYPISRQPPKLESRSKTNLENARLIGDSVGGIRSPEERTDFIEHPVGEIGAVEQVEELDHRLDRIALAK